MSFILISHGARHLQLASDDGHHFMFRIVVDGSRRLLELSGIDWVFGRQPNDGTHVVEHASRFASVCAVDYGLM